MIDYIGKYQTEWKELDELVRKAGKSTARLSPAELGRLDVLYRRTIINLAQATTRTTDQRLIQYLNNLIARTHSLLYLPPRRNALSGTLSYLIDGFPRLVVRTWRFHALSALLLIAGALIAYYAVQKDTTAFYALMPPGDTRLPGLSQEGLEGALRDGREAGHGAKFVFATSLFNHNLKVGLLSLVSGILAAIPSVFLILYNGMILGSFTALHTMKGIHTEYWAWILPHGITELSAIVLFGGCGIKLGWDFIHSTWRTRAEVIRETGRDIFGVCLGCGVMLVLAAFTESYLRQSNLTSGPRLIYAASTAVFWVAYFGRGWWLERHDRMITENPAHLLTP